MAAVVVIIVFLLIFFLSNWRSEPCEDCSPPEISHGKKPTTTWEKNHFINKHLHRDDEKHERHRRNQFPQ